MKCVIVIKNGSGRDQALTFDREEINIGRIMGNDIMINDRSVSGYHAKIRLHNGQAELIDLDSKNGTTVNTEPVKRASLYDQDRITIGNISVQFICPEAISEHAMDQTMIAHSKGWNARKVEQLVHYSTDHVRDMIHKSFKNKSIKTVDSVRY